MHSFYVNYYSKNCSERKQFLYSCNELSVVLDDGHSILDLRVLNSKFGVDSTQSYFPGSSCNSKQL